MTFPVYQAKEWQCRYLFPDQKCCGLPIGHSGEHKVACGHGWHFGGPCDERIADMDTRDGTIYDNKELALAAGVPREDLVTGTREALEKLRTKLVFTKGGRIVAGGDE